MTLKQAFQKTEMKNFRDKKNLLLKLARKLEVKNVQVTKIKNTMTNKTKKTFSKREEKTNTNRNKNTNNTRSFVGGGWDNTGKYGTYVNLQINLDRLNEIEADKYGNVKLTVATRKEADEKSGQDLMVYVTEQR